MRVVMLGTGTDVGKTYVTSHLAQALAKRAKVLALKPIESGVSPGVDGDVERLARAAGHAPATSPWRFTRGVSPHLAAREEQHRIELPRVVDWLLAAEQRAQPDLLLVETAGGVFSPLGEGITNLELALSLSPALWVLVAPDALGVLHDVTATLRALPRQPDAVVLCAARPPDASSGTNARELEALGITRVTAVLGRDGDAASLSTWLLSRLDQR
jgi:dethiobiotin synthetase